MTTAGSGAVNPQSAAQHMFGIGSGVAPSASDPTRFLGPDQGTMQTNPFDRVSHTNFDYPEAVKYSTLFVKSTIEGFILEDIEWYTTLALPWAQTDQMSVTWNEWHFDGHLADRVPHEGVSRLITSSKRQFKAHVVRRGLAFIQEADYAGTPEGEESYARNVMSIAQAVQETQNHDTVFALLTSKNYYKLWQQRFGTAQMSLRQITDAEINLFGSVCLPEGSTTLEVIIEDHKRLMGKKKVVPNMIILWPGAGIYMSMVPPMRTEYWKAGPDGAMRREEGPKSVSQFRGMPMFEARDFDVYDNSPTVQLLTRPVQVSEYYTMRFERRHEDVADFTTKERGIVLYDENVDQWRKIGFLEAFEHARLFERDGKYSNKLVDLLNKYHARDQRPTSLGSIRDDERDEDVSSAVGGNTFFMTAPDNEGQYMLLRYFGQMELKHATEHDMQRIGETIAAKLGKVSIDVWHDMIKLINDIESQPYVHEYWTALIGANTRDSLASNGEFVGETTPDDVAMHWGMRSKQVQWKSNAFGSMRLPTDNAMHNIGFPSGYANVPGLQTLAAEANDPTSPWLEVGKRAKNAIGFLQYMLDTLRTRIGQSAAFDDKGRSPWFHRPDALTTFFENVVGVSRDPLFVASLPAVGGGLAKEKALRANPGKPAAINRKKGMKWFALPGTIAGLKGSNALWTTNKNEGVAELREAVTTGTVNEESSVLETAAFGEDDDGNVLFYSPTLGGTVTVDMRRWSTVMRLTNDVRAFGMMPSGDSEVADRARQAYYHVMRSVADSITRRKFTDFVSQLGQVDPVRMWRAVSGLSLMDSTEIVAAINELHLNDGSGKAKVAASRRRVEALSGSSPPRAAWNDFTALKELWGEGRFDSRQQGFTDLLAFDEIAEDAQRALDLERELIGLSDIRAADFEDIALARGNEDGGVEGVLRNATPSPGLVNQFDAVSQELLAVLGRTGEALLRQDPDGSNWEGWTDAAEQRARAADSRRKGSRMYVSDTGQGIMAGRYFRTPLTSSLHLLQSISGMFGVAEIAKPLVLPSDPSTGHTAPYTWDGDEAGDAGIPGSILSRTNYNPISSAVGRAMDAKNYATMSEVHRDHRLHSLDSTPFVMRHVQAKFEENEDDDDEMSFAPSSRRLFDDADIDSDSDDDVERIFSGAPAMQKRARMSIGGHSSKLSPSATTTMQVEHMGEHKLTRTGAFAERWTQANKIADPLVKVCTKVMLMTKCDHVETWRNMIKNDILVPLDLIAWRAFITHDMASGILMKGGLETGANLHGGANVSKSNDGTSKLIYYNFTFRSKALVWKEKNVAIMENIKFEGYVGGLSTEYVKSLKDLDREDVDRPSIIVTAIPLNEPPLPKMMDFSGELQVPEANIRIDGPKKDHYSTAEYYDGCVWHLSERTTKRSPEHEDFFDRSDRVSVAAFQGMQYSYNRNSGRYSKFVEPQGHLKRNMCYPGAASILNGSAKSFLAYNYELVHIE